MSGTTSRGKTRRNAAVFEVGDAVVHPYHGAGRVVGRHRRHVAGPATQTYLEVELDNASLRILVPCGAAKAIGLRAVVGRRRLRRIVEVLEGEVDVVPERWPARQKHYRAKLKGGDVLDLAAVIRDLARRDAESGLPTTDRELYERSRRVLASELCYALRLDADDAAAYIDEHAAGPALAAG
jgi:CarD family transcriptional regulator